jgi:hypothetical protein
MRPDVWPGKTHILDSSVCDVANDHNLFGLADPQCAPDGLLLNFWVPLRFEEVDSLGHGKVEAVRILSASSIVNETRYGSQTYPTAPVPRVMSSTSHPSGDLKASSTFCRLDTERDPWIKRCLVP